MSLACVFYAFKACLYQFLNKDQYGMRNNRQVSLESNKLRREIEMLMSHMQVLSNVMY